MGRARPGISDQAAEAELSTLLAADIRSLQTVKKGDHMPRILLADGSRLFEGSNSTTELEVDQAPGHAGKRSADSFSNFDIVDDRFFSVMSLPMLQGRTFGLQDTATSPMVVVVNQAFVRRFLPAANPIGRTFHSGDGKDLTRYTVIGVCADTLYNGMRKGPEPMFFEFYRQIDSLLGATYMVRTSLSPVVMLPTLRHTVEGIDPDLPVLNVKSMQAQIDENLRQERMFASLTAGFGLLALLLACVGIYGVMAYTVAQRTNEIGIRLALGAQRGQVRRMVLREAVWLGMAGVGVGLGAALLLSRLVATLLYGLKPNDPLTLAGAGALLLAIALFACWIPAAKASRLEPVLALRHE